VGFQFVCGIENRLLASGNTPIFPESALSLTNGGGTMRVVKVVHATTADQTELEKAISVLQAYDVNEFVATHGPDIMEHSKVFDMPAPAEEDEPSGRRARRALARVADTSYKAIRQAAAMREHCIERAMKKTAEHMLQDLCTRLSRIEILSLDAARERYPRTHNLAIGSYTLHPCDPRRLAQLEHFHRNLASEKDDELIDLLGKMGADTVRIVEREEEQMSATGKIEMETIPVGPELSLSKRISRDRELVVVYEGTDFEIDPYLLENSLWFTNDSQLNAIFQSRCSSNPIREYTLRSTYTQTFDFDFAAAISVMAVKVDLRAEYETLKATERFFHVDFGKH